MAKFNYDEFADLALELIDETGKASEFIRNEGVPVDVAKPWLGDTLVPVSYPTYAVRLPAGQKDVAFLPEGTSLSTTAKILMEAVEMVQIPTIADKVKHDGIEMQITAVKPLKPADVNVMWTVYVQV
jgi:hypothetical protein